VVKAISEQREDVILPNGTHDPDLAAFDAALVSDNTNTQPSNDDNPKKRKMSEGADDADEDASGDADEADDEDEDLPSFEEKPPTKGEYVRTVKEGHEGQIVKVFPKKKVANVAWLFTEGGYLKGVVKYPPAAKGKFLKSDQIDPINFDELVRWNGSEAVCTNYTVAYWVNGYCVVKKDGTRWRP